MRLSCLRKQGRTLMNALDIEDLAVEANQLPQGLAILRRVARDVQQQ